MEPLPPRKKALNCRWVFKLKVGLGGTPSIKKARLVVKGFEQKEGIDFTETFALVIKWATIRIAIAIATTERWTIHHMDVRTAFLNGLLKEQVFMKQPPGF